MATLTVGLPADLKALAEARAAEAGFGDVGQFLAQLIVGEAAGAPEGLTVHSEDDMETLLKSRIAGPFVEMDAADFQQMRKTLGDQLKQAPEDRP